MVLHTGSRTFLAFCFLVVCIEMNRAAPPTLLPLETFFIDEDVFCREYLHTESESKVFVFVFSLN